jgi:hypothetical protein
MKSLIATCCWKMVSIRRSHRRTITTGRSYQLELYLSISMRGARRGGRGNGRHNYDGRGRGDGVIVGGLLQLPVGQGRGRMGRGRAPAIPAAITPPQLAVENNPPLQIQYTPFVIPTCPQCNPLPLPGDVNIPRTNCFALDWD